MNYFRLPKLTFWRTVLVVILILAAYTTVIRFTQGLGATTNLSDAFPWGLWVGFDVLCGVGLAAGGFTVTAIVYIFNTKRFKPITRSAVLTAFLGYSLVVVALMFDLGRPWNIWHPIIMWNPHSVMFEVGWCVTLYSTVLALEFSPIVFERLGWNRPVRIIHGITIPLVIAGFILSTLHQSSLGSLFLIVPEKLYPFWYSPLLPVLFFVSALSVGCAMVIVESFWSARAFGKRLEMDILVDLGRACLVLLSIYFVIRLQDFWARDLFSLLTVSRQETYLFISEVLLGTIIPAVLLAVPKIRASKPGLFLAAFLVVLGFILNRLNVSISGIEAASGVAYFPKWTEIIITAAVVGVGCAVFELVVRFFPVFPEGPLAATERAAREFTPSRHAGIPQPDAVSSATRT